MTGFLLTALVTYLAVGILAALVLKQSPYADNPVWKMVLLWPLFFFG